VIWSGEWGFGELSLAGNEVKSGRNRVYDGIKIKVGRGVTGKFDVDDGVKLARCDPRNRALEGGGVLNVVNWDAINSYTRLTVPSRKIGDMRIGPE
jgi:hypothetical protein